MHQMQWQGHTECPSPSLSNLTTTTKVMEEKERKNEEEHAEFQDQDPRGSPHKEEKVIGGNVDLDLISLFPQEYARFMGGMGRNGKLFKR